ncbi:hypothetical protein LINPERHAP1_LOCUS174, partial [Linum perenne]
GTVVEGNSHRAHVDILGPRLTVGSIYKVTGHGLQMPRKSYRVASYDRMLTLSPVTSFKLISSPSPTFALNAFEFIQFGLLHTHVIGRAISVSRRNHIDGTHGMAKAQVVVLVDAQSVEFSVTLWEDISLILDPVSLAEADLRKPVVIGLAGLMVSGFNSVVSGRSSAGTRIVVNPPVLETKTLEKNYKIKMRASDDSGTATFVLLGRTTDYVMSVSAADLVRAFPATESTLPPPIEKLRQRILTFEVRVPLNPRPGATGDFNVSRVWGLEQAFDDQPSTNAAPTVLACGPSVSPSSSKCLVADMDDSSGESDDSDVSHGHSPSLSTPIPKDATEELCDPGVSVEQLHVLFAPTPKTTGVCGKRRARQPKDSTSDHLCLIVVLVFPGGLLGRKTDANLPPKGKCLDTGDDDDVPLCVFARRAKRQASSPDLSVQL